MTEKTDWEKVQAQHELARKTKERKTRERPAFEQYIRSSGWGPEETGPDLHRFLDDYADGPINCAWFGWLARAELSEATSCGAKISMEGGKE